MITAFCVLAEPEKLLYPYIESLRSVSRFCEKIVINYAASKNNDYYRDFEEVSYLKLLDLSKEVEDHCQIILKMDEQWKHQKDSSYEDLSSKFQSCLDDVKSGWFLKFDADNVFRSSSSTSIKKLFKDDIDEIVFRRINVIDKNRAAINHGSYDIYAINVDSLSRKSLPYYISPNRWCCVDIEGQRSTIIVEDKDIIPYNYDATFFTKERIIEFWRKTEEMYSNAHKRPNVLLGKSDEHVLKNYFDYKNSKNSSSRIFGCDHPEDIRERMESIGRECWGYSNFKSTNV